MDVRINRMTSNVHVADTKGLLDPEVLRSIVDAVVDALDERERLNAERERDTRVERSAVNLDGR